MSGRWLKLPELPPDTLPASYTDSWEEFRAASWGLGDITVTELLGLIGAAGKPGYEQRRLLRAWTTTAAYPPAPAVVKAKVESFLRTGINPDAL